MRRTLIGFSCLLLAIVGACANPLMHVGGVGARLAFGITYITSASDTSDLTTYTYASQNIGTDVGPGNARYTVISAGGLPTGGSIASTGATICGVTATNIAVATSNVGIGLYIAETSGLGTSCTITTTWDSTGNAAGIGIFRLINPVSATPFAFTTSMSTDPLILSINIATGGAAIGAMMLANGGASTWTGLTEDFDTDINTSDFHTAAHGGSAGTPTTISVDPSSQGGIVGVSASWSP